MGVLFNQLLESVWGFIASFLNGLVVDVLTQLLGVSVSLVVACLILSALVGA